MSSLFKYNAWRWQKQHKTCWENSKSQISCSVSDCWVSDYRNTFCRYWCVTCVYRILYMYVKHSSRGTSLKFYRRRYWEILPHPLLKPISDVNFLHFWHVCKVSWIWLILKKKKKLNNSNRVLAHRCSGPNKSQQNMTVKMVWPV